MKKYKFKSKNKSITSKKSILFSPSVKKALQNSTYCFHKVHTPSTRKKGSLQNKKRNDSYTLDIFSIQKSSLKSKNFNIYKVVKERNRLKKAESQKKNLKRNNFVKDSMRTFKKINSRLNSFQKKRNHLRQIYSKRTLGLNKKVHENSLKKNSLFNSRLALKNDSNKWLR